MITFRKLSVFTASLIAFSYLSASAQAETTIWDHNGSLMRFEQKDKKRRFVYDQPRSTLDGAGVKSGTILFDGELKKDGRLAGYAKLFRKGCQPVDYFVEGAYDKNNGEILLQGQAPIYSGDGCKITGYTDDGSASTLKFTRQGGSDNRHVSADDEPYRSGSGSQGSYQPPRATYRQEAEPDRSGIGATAESEDTRDYAYQPSPNHENRRYDGAYYPRRDDDERPENFDPYYDDYEEDEPAYTPYQPRWRRFGY